MIVADNFHLMLLARTVPDLVKATSFTMHDYTHK